MKNKTIQIQYDVAVEKAKSFLIQETEKLVLWGFLFTICTTLVFNVSPFFLLPLSYFGFRMLNILNESTQIIVNSIKILFLMRKLKNRGII